MFTAVEVGLRIESNERISEYMTSLEYPQNPGAAIGAGHEFNNDLTILRVTELRFLASDPDMLWIRGIVSFDHPRICSRALED